MRAGADVRHIRRSANRPGCAAFGARPGVVGDLVGRHAVRLGDLLGRVEQRPAELLVRLASLPARYSHSKIVSGSMVSW